MEMLDHCQWQRFELQQYSSIHPTDFHSKQKRERTNGSIEKKYSSYRKFTCSVICSEELATD